MNKTMDELIVFEHLVHFFFQIKSRYP